MIPHRFLTSLILGGSLLTSLADIVSPAVEADFTARETTLRNAGIPNIGKLRLTPEQTQCLKMLYAYMPMPDMTDRTADYYLEMVVNPALQARAEMPWGKSVPDELFRHFVLPIRVNNEALDNHRPEFYKELKDRVKGLSMKDAILEVNHWCHEKVTYQPSDGRTHSPLQSVSSVIGRCGEESTFAVAALRSVGIPARQVYTPRWAHTDDNHAWVEAWADGKWYFLGACEPEPVLNLGWFNAPASRGMLMHARVFGNYEGGEERLEKIDGITFINVTGNYTPVDTLSVTVRNSDGTPAAGTDVTFRIYNYAEFYPIAAKRADNNGSASLIAGKGDILVWATDGTKFGYKKCSVGKDRTATLTLDHNSDTPINEDFDIVPPSEHKISPEVTAEMRRINDLRGTREDSIRMSYTAKFITPEQAAEIASRLNVDADKLMRILPKSRGNHAVILKFLEDTPAENRDKAVLLLESVSDKDLTDVPYYVLADHLNAVDYGAGELFGEYVMSPRIYMDELTPFRSFFTSVYPAEKMESFRSAPESWVKWVADSITPGMSWYPGQITMSPEAVWNNRKTSDLSRDVFFVAGARSFGIPARIDPVTGKTQWADNKGKWHDVTFSELADASSTLAGSDILALTYKPTAVVPDPKYYTHFSVSSLDGGEPRQLNYPDFVAWSETFREGQPLDKGTYLVVTGQRMADGSVLAHVESVKLDAEKVTAPLTIRHDDSQVQVIGSFDAESRYMPEDAELPASVLSTTGRGYYVLGLLRPNHEPSNHALRDLAVAADKLNASGRPIVLLTESDSVDDLDLRKQLTLPEQTSYGVDTDHQILDKIKAGVNLTSDELPMFIIADTFNRVVFVIQGYNIGTGEQLSNILHRIE
ncbi:MAG: transglutaminase domain-containing protein [Muribaculaceae bacterium]|nr:transglutaminase domain-containing protein [Muribaculaceae bacterium]